jgi:hypothetical protein
MNWRTIHKPFDFTQFAILRSREKGEWGERIYPRINVNLREYLSGKKRY